MKVLLNMWMLWAFGGLLDMAEGFYADACSMFLFAIMCFCFAIILEPWLLRNPNTTS